MIGLINIAVVDDEKHIRNQVKAWLGKIEGDYRVETYAAGEELLQTGRYYDIIFLDIQMDGLNGIETARELREQQKESLLIFITGVKEYVFEAFDVAAFHYLLKPISEDKFREVFSRAITEIKKRENGKQKRLFIKTRNRNYSLNQNDIVYIESRAKKVEIHTTVSLIEAYAAMSEMEKELGEVFYRCHRGYLVNLAFIVRYSADRITLSSGEELILAKERYGEFVKAYLRYLKNGGSICD